MPQITVPIYMYNVPMSFHCIYPTSPQQLGWVRRSIFKEKYCWFEFSFPSPRLSTVGWGCRIHQLHLCRGVRLPECPSYDTKESEGETPVIEELWGMQSTPLLPLLPGPLWPWVVAPDRVLSIGQIELFDI